MTRKGKKHRERGDNPPQETKSNMECPPKSKKSDEVHVQGGILDGAGPSETCRELALEPKHRIFLSHSGAQKNFTWQLCEDLERVQHYPFFDRRDYSLPKGEKFPPLILEAARQCRVAVLILSDEFFTRSKWPMIELNEFVKAQESHNQDLKILPLFLGLTVEEFHNKKRQAGWFKKWEKFACLDKRIKVEEWKASLSRIPGGINVEEYGGASEGEVEFRKKVVRDICRLLPIDLKYDVSHVQSLERLCEPIKKKLEDVGVSCAFNVKVVGLYGVGGVGKTTISTAICNEMSKGFGGKVCHVEFGGDSKALVKLQKRVLQECTSVDATLVSKSEPKKLDALLKQHMNQQDVFLVLDNVWDDEVDEASKYLKIGHHSKSMVLVTSRSIEVLKRVGIEECSCMEMTKLEVEGAKDVFLHYGGISRESIVDESEWKIVDRYVEYCCFSREKRGLNGKMEYHPLALKALGSQLVTFKIKDWDEKMNMLDKFNRWKDGKHPVFSVLRVGFDLLQRELQELFLDLALLWTTNSPISEHRYEERLEYEWLCTLHSSLECEMKANVEVLQRKGLLEKVHDITTLDYNIHDLYYDFARAEVEAGPFEERGLLINNYGTDVPGELKRHPPNGVSWPHLKRLIILHSEVKSLMEANLHHCKNVEIFVLAHCQQLEEVDVTGMHNLRLMVIFGGGKLGKVTGLETLKNLVYFTFQPGFLWHPVIKCKLAFCSTKLQVVRLGGYLGFPIRDVSSLGLHNCTSLNEVILKYPITEAREESLYGFKYLPTSLQMLHLEHFNSVERSPIRTMASLRNLQDLRLCAEGIEELVGLCKLILLQRLDVAWTHITTIPDDLKDLKHLHYLDVSNCKHLTSIVGIVHATALQTVLAWSCEALREVPHDLSSLQHLEVLDLRGDREISTLPLDYRRLAEYSKSERKLKMEVSGCYGLIEPLVWKLRGSDVAQDACEDGCKCVSRESMTSWAAAKKKVDVAAYKLLKNVFGGTGFPDIYWAFLLDDDNDEVLDVLIRGLFEHNIRGSRTNEGRTDMVWEVIQYESDFIDHIGWWVVVATAPCTFKVVTDGVTMKPWGKTLLHYTITSILPIFLQMRDCMIKCHRTSYRTILNEDDNLEEVSEEQGDECNTGFLETWHYRAITAVLHKCGEKLDDACEEGIDLVRCHEGKRVVHTLLSELKALAAKSEILEDGSILRVSWDTDRVSGDTTKYQDVFPNFPFERTLATEIVEDCQIWF